MNKLFKKLLVLVLALTLAFAMVGCEACNKGDGDGGSGSTPPPAQQPEGPDTSTVQPEDPSITMIDSLNFILGEVKSANVTTKNIDGEVVYSTSNPEVATVANGYVTAVGAGTAIIKAEYGQVSDTCSVTVSYGDYLPSLEIQSNLTETTTIAVEKTYDILPYVNFNNTPYYTDAEFEYEVSDESVLTVSDAGVITTHKTGTATITINTAWRDFSSKTVEGKTQTDTLTQSYEITVRDNVAFYDNGNLLKSFSINTPASFQEASEYNNTHVVNPTVIVNGVESAVPASDIKVSPVGASVENADYTWNASTNTVTALQMRADNSGVVVEFKYTGADSVVYVDNFIIYFERPVEVLTTGVELFSAKRGTYKKVSGTSYVENTLENFAWGKDVTLLDAYQDGNALTINNTTGAVTGLSVNHDTHIDTTVVLGTMTEVYEIPVKAAMMYMSNAQDVKLALERVNDPISETGYHLMLNDIDMSSVLIDNRISGENAKVYTDMYYNGNLVSQVPRNINFSGVFDGDGYVLYNATTVLPQLNKTLYPEWDFANNKGIGSYTNDPHPSYGLFHIINTQAVIKDVAFVNLKGTGTTADAFGLSGPLTWKLRGTVENCYIDIAKENPTTRGPFAVIESNSSIKNCVINYPMAKDDYVFMNEAETVSSQSLTAWGYGSLAQDVSGMTKTPTGYANIYVISKAPVSFSTGGATGLNDDTSASSAITYAENETKLLYPFKAFDEVHGDVEHTVQSTVGEHKEAYDKVQVTGKTRVVQSVQRYDSYEDFANSTYAGIELYNEHYNRDSRWVVTGNVPIWHSLIDEHTDKFYATVNNGTDLEIDCYDTATLDVKLYGGSVEDLVLSTTSDLISIEDNVITALKVGEDASVTAKFKFGGKEYTRVYSVDVLVPFYFNDGTSDFDVSASVREGAELTLSVKIKGNNVENVTYATTATEFISLVDNKVTGVKLNKGNVVTASFTYEGTAYVLDIIIDVLDPIAEDAIVTVNGVNLEDESFNVVIGENATIDIISGTSTVTSVSVVDAKGLFTTNNNVITAQLYGETTLQVSFTIGSKTHVKAVKATTERTTETITTAVDFDGYEGVILSSAIDNSGVVNAVVTYGEEDPFILNKENGGILADGKIRVKTAKLDAVAGFPYITKREFAESPVINVVLGTNKKIYTFTNVVFWTSIIEDATELKAALDMDYAVATHNHGFYKLANNIDATGMTFVYNKFTTAVANQNSNAGFMGLFDGCGYTISNYTVGQYGLFGAFLYNASSSAVGGPVIKDVAFTNVSATTGVGNQGVYSLLGRYTPDHNYWPTCHLKVSNLYVSFKDDSNVNGLFGFNGYSHLNNIVIDTEGNTVAPGSVLAGDEYGAAVSGKAITFNHNQYTDGSALFQNTRFMNPERASTNYIDNVITLGATPVVYQWGYGTNYYNNWKYENNTWVKFNTGTLNPFLTIETYMGYAGNQEKGDIPVMTGMKDGFKAICGTNTDALKGYVCTTCGETFSLEAGECAKCSVTLTEFANLWTTPWSFTWELTDIATWENLYENSVYKTGIYVFKGVSKYNTTNAMKSAYTADNTIFSSFTGEAGNNMWSVSADGVLSWKGTTAQA